MRLVKKKETLNAGFPNQSNVPAAITVFECLFLLLWFAFALICLSLRRNFLLFFHTQSTYSLHCRRKATWSLCLSEQEWTWQWAKLTKLNLKREQSMQWYWNFEKRWMVKQNQSDLCIIIIIEDKKKRSDDWQPFKFSILKNNTMSLKISQKFASSNSIERSTSQPLSILHSFFDFNEVH